MLYMNIIPMIVFLPLCISDTPYLLGTYPTESKIQESSFTGGPCVGPIAEHKFLQGETNETLEDSECVHDSAKSILTCKLGINNATATLNFDSYPLTEIKVLLLFVQEFPVDAVKSRVLDLCFLRRFGSALKELAICGYKPPITKEVNMTNLHILDMSALAIYASNIQTLLITGVNVWQIIELRQFSSLKHLLILQGATLQMHYFHSPHCADCISAHPSYSSAFHYLIPLSSQLTYFLYDNPYRYDKCNFDLLKKFRSNPGTISTFIVASNAFSTDSEPICQTCASFFCPLLAVCLDKGAPGTKDPNSPFECLCVEDVDVENEFQPCDPLTLHQPMYSTRCNHTPSFWNYVTRMMIICSGYLLSSIIVLIFSTIFLCKSK